MDREWREMVKTSLGSFRTPCFDSAPYLACAEVGKWWHLQWHHGSSWIGTWQFWHTLTFRKGTATTLWQKRPPWQPSGERMAGVEPSLPQWLSDQKAKTQMETVSTEMHCPLGRLINPVFRSDDMEQQAKAEWETCQVSQPLLKTLHSQLC